ncbi:fusion protein (includes pXO2-28-29-30) [Metabacillus sp. SLBN-84]
MVRFCLAGMMALSIVPPSAHAEAPLQSEVEDESVKQHELFEFEASIKHGDIVDGTEGFDSNDEPGNDSGPHNGIVRSWDSVTYPLKVTINPKKADKLEKIKLKISGELENGVTGARINAKFAVGGKEDVNGKKVSFVQEYTIERTGNSIMIPVAIEVLGAKPGVNLTPKLQVQVVSVDGVTIEKDNVVTAFHDLPGITVSSKVSIKPYVNSGLYRNGIPNYPYSRISGDPDDKRNMHAFSLSWSIANLPGKSNFRGATFPDPEGKINFRIELEGEVAWDQPARTEKLDFDGRDTPFMMIDHRPISFIHNAVGSKNTLMDGISYRFDKSPFYGAPLSQLANMNESETRRSVWDSGEWEVTKPDQGKHVVTYEGSNTGYVIGSTFPRYEAGGFTGYSIFNANDRFFASHSFLVLLPNEYRIGGPNNQDDKGNNVNYKATATLLSYTDENGTNIPLANPLKSSMFFTERNNPKGAYATHGTFQGNPSGRWLGTPNVGWHSVSKGDASSLLGEDVFFHVDLGPQVTSYGGYRAVYRWNTDAFELTEKYAKDAENILYDNGYITPMLHEVRNNRETQQVLYGVPKFTDNEFRNFTSKGINDYEWFATFAQAKATGKPIGAIQRNITAPVGPGWRGGGRVPLRVKHENIGIGSKTKNGTANVAVVNWYVYPKEDRSMMIDISEGRAYHNPAIWDENGTMLQKQSPSGSTINFETLAVVPAETSSVLTSDKSSYYNSETIKWTVDNSIVLPESGVPDNLDAGVTVKNTLPAGLDYKAGSGKAGNQVTEPEIMRHPDGSKTLVWRLLVSNSNRSIPRVTFETTINPFALDTNGVQSSIEVKSVIESELDKRQEHLRTTTKSVTILKVGMVGIYESIDKTYGDKNSDFTLTLSPYTTIEDEQGVTGLTHLPLSGDRLGSEYSGTAKIKAINQTIERRHNEPVRIFLNHQPVHSTHPKRN